MKETRRCFLFFNTKIFIYIGHCLEETHKIVNSKKMSLLETVLKRWESETPEFFKGVRKVAVVLATLATALIVANETSGLAVGAEVLSVCKYVLAACAAMGVTAQLTAKTPPTEEKPQP